MSPHQRERGGVLARRKTEYGKRNVKDCGRDRVSSTNRAWCRSSAAICISARLRRCLALIAGLTPPARAPSAEIFQHRQGCQKDQWGRQKQGCGGAKAAEGDGSGDPSNQEKTNQRQ